MLHKAWQDALRTPTSTPLPPDVGGPIVIVSEDACVDVCHDSRKLHSGIIEKQK